MDRSVVELRCYKGHQEGFLYINIYILLYALGRS